MTNTATNDYSVSIHFSSKDAPSKQVEIGYSFSHDLDDRLLEEKDMPPSYTAAFDIATIINMMQSKESFNYTDEELESMSPEAREEAIREAAANAIHTIKVDRIS